MQKVFVNTYSVLTLSLSFALCCEVTLRGSQCHLNQSSRGPAPLCSMWHINGWGSLFSVVPQPP